jgi:hypothetical protein
MKLSMAGFPAQAMSVIEILRQLSRRSRERGLLHRVPHFKYSAVSLADIEQRSLSVSARCQDNAVVQPIFTSILQN